MGRAFGRDFVGGELFEALEPRVVLFAWTAQEVLFAELINRARSDPFAEGARTGVDVLHSLTAEERARVRAVEPLALNEALTLAARGHNQDMAARSFFAHDNPDGLDPSDRARNAGYGAGAGENIAAGQSSVYEAHVGLLDSVGHRMNILSLHGNFSSGFHYNELGTGALPPGSVSGTQYQSYYGQMFGVGGGGAFVLGVAIADADGDRFYDLGEGMGGVRVDVSRVDSPEEVVQSYTTGAAGNYQLRVGSGEWMLTFVDEATGFATRRAVSVGADNVKVDVLASEMTGRLDVNASARRDAVVSGAFARDGSLTVVTVNEDGRPISLRFADGRWSADDLVTLAGGTNTSRDVVAWVDPKDGRSYAASVTGDGLVLYAAGGTAGPGGATWSSTNVTVATDGVAISGEITAFVDQRGLAHVAGLSSDGDLLLYRQTGAVASDGGWSWEMVNLSAEDLAGQGMATPAFEGRLVSYVTAWNGLTIAGLDASGDIQAAWWAPGRDAWATQNLSVATGAAPMSGGLTAWLTSWGGINLAGVDESGAMTAVWWVPSRSGWRQVDLTAAANGPELRGETVASFVTGWGAMNIAGTDSAGRMVVYWWVPGGGGWRTSVLSETVTNAPMLEGPVRGVSGASDISLLGQRANGDVARYWWQAGAGWSAENISMEVGAGMGLGLT